MRSLVINNLNSGLRDGSIHDFIRCFVAEGDETVIRSTTDTSRVGELLYDAADFDLVVASGGDSTVAAACFSARNSGVPVLPFPAGTGNLVAVNLGHPDEPHALAALARMAESSKFDLGVLETSADDGTVIKRSFAVMAGAGYDASIMRRAEKLKGQLGAGAYLASALADPMPTVAHFTVTLDDEVLEVEGIAILVINFAEIMPDFSITHGYDAADGFFEVVILKPHNAAQLLPAVFAAFLDAVGSFPGRFDALEVRRSSKVHVVADPPLHIQADGEPLSAKTPFSAEVLHGAASFVVCG